MQIPFTHTAVYKSDFSAEQCKQFATILQNKEEGFSFLKHKPYRVKFFDEGFIIQRKSVNKFEPYYPSIRCEFLAESPCLVRLAIQPNYFGLFFFSGTALALLLAFFNAPTINGSDLSVWGRLFWGSLSFLFVYIMTYSVVIAPVYSGRTWIIKEMKLILVRL